MTLVVGVAALVYQLIVQTPALDAGVWAFQAAISVFLAWAITRELDPDHPISAMLAAVLTTALIWWTGPANLFILAWILAALRASIGTVGLPLTWLDIGFITIAGGWLIYADHISLGAMLIVVFISEMRRGANKALMKTLMILSILTIVVMVIIALLGHINIGIPLQDSVEMYWLVFALISSLAFLKTAKAPKENQVSVWDDVGKKQLSIKNLKYVRSAVLIPAVLLAMLGVFAKSLMPLYASLFVIGVYDLVLTFSRKETEDSH